MCLPDLLDVSEGEGEAEVGLNPGGVEGDGNLVRLTGEVLVRFCE